MEKAGTLKMVPLSPDRESRVQEIGWCYCVMPLGVYCFVFTVPPLKSLVYTNIGRLLGRLQEIIGIDWHPIFYFLVGSGVGELIHPTNLMIIMTIKGI